MEDLNEAVEIAERTLELENAKENYQVSKHRSESYSGLRRPLGWLSLKRATNEAINQGLIIINGDVIMPQVVSKAYFSAIEDDIPFADREIHF